MANEPIEYKEMSLRKLLDIIAIENESLSIAIEEKLKKANIKYRCACPCGCLVSFSSSSLEATICSNCKNDSHKEYVCL